MIKLRIYLIKQVWTRLLFCLQFLVMGGALFCRVGFSEILLSEQPLRQGFLPISFVSQSNIKNYVLDKTQEKNTLTRFCADISKEFNRYGWEKNPCLDIPWKVKYKTTQGHPLIYAQFGEGSESTLIFGGVHPDELNPVDLSFRFARYLNKNPDVYKGKDIRVIVAPLVNPDGFIRKQAIRTNHHSVDLNRNFLTLDWYDKALEAWTIKRKSDFRYFPGYFPNTEIETIFQTELITEYKPSKILSLHAPFGFLDYDGPGDQKSHYVSSIEIKARELVKKVAEKSKNYRIVDYSFYPGSLGNFAGNERHIPTLTLEFAATTPSLAVSYWDQFLPGFIQSVQYSLR